jgi:hypothetical protein
MGLLLVHGLKRRATGRETCACACVSDHWLHKDEGWEEGFANGGDDGRVSFR